MSWFARRAVAKAARSDPRGRRSVRLAGLGIRWRRVTGPGERAVGPADASRTRTDRSARQPLEEPFENSRNAASSGAGELDDDRPHLRHVGPGAVGHVGRPQDRLTGVDPERSPPTATQPPPSITTNQVVFGFECGSIRAFRAKASSLISRARRVDHLAGDPDRAGRAVWSPVADAEPDDFDGIVRPPPPPSRRRPAPAARAGAATPAAGRSRPSGVSGSLGRRDPHAGRPRAPSGGSSPRGGRTSSA